MLADHPEHRFRIEESTPVNDFGRKKVIYHRPKVSRKPSADRRGESGLGSVDHAVGYDSLHRLLENPLAAEVPNLEFRRKAECQIDKVVVQERNSHLNRRRHTHSVDIVQVVTRQIHSGIDE